MKKKTIIAIVGKSGSGKTHIAEYIKSKHNIPTLVSYTTRPMRAGETNGKEHWFVDESKMLQKDEMLAYTKFGGFHYWTEISQIDGCAGDYITYVIDEIGLVGLASNFSDKYNICPVLVQRSASLIEREIDCERVKRDDYRIILSDSYYDHIIYNDGTIEDLENEVNKVVELIKYQK